MTEHCLANICTAGLSFHPPPHKSTMSGVTINNAEDVCDVEGGPCPICLKEFDNGDTVIVLSCIGRHFLCEDCHEGYPAHDGQEQAGDQCPVCRQMSHCAIEVVAQNFYPGSGKTEATAIVIE